MGEVSSIPHIRQEQPPDNIVLFRGVREETRAEYLVNGVDVVTTPDPTLRDPSDTEGNAFDVRIVVDLCGGMAAAVYAVMDANDRDGQRTTYARLEDQFGMSERQMRYIVKRLVDAGLVSVEKGGGRGIESSLIPVLSHQNPAINSANNSAIDSRVIGVGSDERIDGQNRGQSGEELPVNSANNSAMDSMESPETLQKRVHETLQSPPTPPVCENVVNTKTPNIHTAKPKKPLPENGPAQQIIAAFCRVAGLEQPAVYRKAAGQAANLVKAKVTPADVPSLYAYTVGWAGSADLGNMLSSVDRWRQKHNGRGKPDEVDPDTLPYGSEERAKAIFRRSGF